jgi:hypothetical protein
MFATIGFISAGVGAAATLATYLLWQPEERGASARGAQAHPRWRYHRSRQPF